MTAILVVDHDIEFAELIRDWLRDRKYVAEAVQSAKDAVAHMDRNPVDIVVAHVHLRHVSGLELVSRLRDRQSEVLGIVVTSQGSLEPPLRARPGDVPILTTRFLHDIAQRSGRSVPTLSDDASRKLDEIERRYIRQVLAATRNNKTDAARILGIDRRSLYRRVHDRDPGAGGEPAAAD